MSLILFKGEELMSACRDCKICTRLGVVKLIMIIPGLIYSILLSWNVGLFMKKCPDCNHLLSKHLKRKDGSFAD